MSALKITNILCLLDVNEQSVVRMLTHQRLARLQKKKLLQKSLPSALYCQWNLSI